MFAVRQNDGCHAEADGRGQRQAKQDRPHVTLRSLTGESATGLSVTGACIIMHYDR
jgi:hypothetical protein